MRLAPLFLLLSVAWISLAALNLAAQEPPTTRTETKPDIPTIADEPQTIDPAQFMSAPLAEKATVEFKDSSLRELLDWFREEKKLVVLLDNDALAEIEVLPSDPVADRLNDEPGYFLLNRLSALGLAWYFEDEVLYVTSEENAEDRVTTLSHGVGDLLDAGYKGESLIETITSTVAPETWEEVGGPGAVSLLGDVLFVLQRDELQREVRGLLAALRTHGRRTFLYNPPQNLLVRQRLEENVTVDFRDMPLESAMRELSEKTQIDIRLERLGLREAGIRERHPISLAMTDRKLKTVLRAMLSDPELTWLIKDGVLWITTPERAEERSKTALYDVRDLCRDDKESKALSEAITSQADPAAWEEVGGPASLRFARPGLMVINATESLLDEVLELLEAYRTALRASKPRSRPEDEASKVSTVYYRMHSNVAMGLRDLLPKLVQADSWKNDARPEAPGEIILAPSTPELNIVDGTAAKQTASELAMLRSVLIVHQTNAAHEEIQKIIRRVESGDSFGAAGGIGGMGGMGGGGGFGGGFFDVPSGTARETNQR